MLKRYGMKVGLAMFLFGITQYVTNISMGFVAAAFVFLLPYFWHESRMLFVDVKRYKQTTEFVGNLASLIRTHHTLNKAMEYTKPDKYPDIEKTLRRIKQRIAAGNSPSSVFIASGYEENNKYLVELGKLFRILKQQGAKKEFMIERLESLRISFENENIDREQGAKGKKRMLNHSLFLNLLVVFIVFSVMPGLIKNPYHFYFKTGMGQVLSIVGVLTLLLPHLYVFFIMKGRELA